MSKRILALAAVLAVAAAAGGAAAARHAAGTKVVLHKTGLGKVLATSSGFTLYLYTPDPKGKSVCTGSCAAAWPPLLTKGKPTAGPGVKAKLLGTAKRGGKLQVTYAGHPLYRYAGDSKAGQTAGEGVGGIWYALSAGGKKVTRKSDPGGGGTTTSGGGYGTGY
jgi:predicted lipoprotein with Yx(FWY)xxD motif